ncbi:Plant invertase/pectin methylesterase inhibitor superfamily protein [Rhynchospora pubera]|uniref:Plant invertase/pectin methylesterase inhibitor superfamily protein n=1 Tax=Rhynchospora pubera TaxID=906938 RepID=A0AAV8F2G9_9POAL|nr:Plant invertase/pectin methylesterase inhibitor superfamily protein [Rhynchospora pubera]
MRSCILSFSLLFLLSYHPLTSSAASSKLDEVCNNLGGWYVSRELCHSVFSADPQSPTADLDGIAIISANIAAKNATSVIADLNKVLKASTDPDHQKALQTCLQVYTDVIPKLNSVTESIKSKKFAEAENVFNAALGVPAKCDDATANYPPVRALVDKDDVYFSSVVLVAKAVSGYLASN